MAKFVTVVLAVAVSVVFGASAIAGGWKTGNWEPPKKAPVVKAVSLNADWGTTAVAPAASVAPAGCRGMAQHTHAEPAQRAGCNGRGWFRGFLMNARANRQARARDAQARARSHAKSKASGHS